MTYISSGTVWVGVVILRMLESYQLRFSGRIVCLGSPLQGSVAGKALARFPGGKKILGRSMKSLIEDGPILRWEGTQELGLVAGSVSLGAGQLICNLPNPHDGSVAVEETRLEGATDRIVLPVSHLSMLTSRAVADQVVSFLKSCRFQR